MRYTLLESGARSERHPAGTMVSILLHGGAIALAIVSTTREVLPAEHPTTPQALVYAAPPQPVTRTAMRPTTGRDATRSATDITSVRHVPIAPVHIPRKITAVDLSDNPTNQHLFDGSPTTLTGGDASGGDGSLGGPADGVWSEARVDRAVMGLPGNPRPQYPEALRAAHVEGTVLARFVVDSTGRVEPGSIMFPESTHPRFEDAVRAALLASHYYPAEVGGWHVRQLVEQRFAFRLER